MVFAGKHRLGWETLDALLLNRMVEAGAVLAYPRLVQHYLYGKHESAMSAAADNIRAAGYQVDSRPAASGGQWLLLANRHEIVDAQTVAAARRFFEQLAAEIDGGEYDGWDAAIADDQAHGASRIPPAPGPT